MSDLLNSITQGQSVDSKSSGVAGVSNKNANLGQEDFLKLLVAQMNFQNPLEPQENGDFIAQMAQFGTVDGIQELQKSFQTLTQSLQSNQALQASTLVGRKVEVRANGINTQEAGQRFEGSIELDQPMSNIMLSVFNQSGELVRSQVLGDAPGGHFEFAIEGVHNSGETLPAGRYTIKAEGNYGNERFALPTYLAANVDSVTLGAGGSSDLTLSLAGLGEAKLEQIRQIS